MEVETLRWFQQVADGVTVTEVSELEMVSQPAVSRALARLEREVGATLLRREGRVLRMTHAGAAFKRHLDAVLHHLDDGLAAVQQTLDPETGLVTIAYQPSLGAWLVPEVVADFLRVHPGVQFDLRSWTDVAQRASGPGSDVDLEFSVRHHHDPHYEWHHLGTEPIRLLVPPDHWAATAQAPVSLGRFAAERFVMLRRESPLRPMAEALCREAGFEPQVAFVAQDISALRGFVAAGLGVGLYPGSWGGDEIHDPPGRPKPVELALTDFGAVREIGLTWWREAKLLPSAQLFIRHVLARAKQGRLPGPLPTSAKNQS